MLIHILFSLLPLFFTLYETSVYQGKNHIKNVMASKPQDPLHVNLHADRIDNTSYKLSLTMVPLIDAKNVNLEIKLPQSFIVTSGQASWSGSLKKGEIKTIEVAVTTSSYGSFQVIGTGSIIYAPQIHFSASDVVTLDILKPGEKISKKPETTQPVKFNSKGEKIVELKANLSKEK